MINAGMVFSDRHYGGINYPKGGVGQIAQKLVEGLQNFGGQIQYKARVTKILIESGRAIGVQLASGKTYRAKRVISNATRWDTFEKLLPPEKCQSPSANGSSATKNPQFLSLHLGVKAEALPPETECHHILLEDWEQMEKAEGTIFVSIPTLLDPDLAPPNHHIIHTFTPHWIEDWQDLSPSDYQQRKEAAAKRIITRLEKSFQIYPFVWTIRKLEHPAPIVVSWGVMMVPMVPFQLVN